MKLGRMVAVIMLACAALPPAQAGSFSISPIRLDLASGQGATALTVSNEGDDAKLIQVSVLRWTREGGEDRTANDDTVVVTPPLFQLAAKGGSQVVRIGFASPPAPLSTERAWRVIAEEVQPSAAESGAGASINLRLRISLPLFLAPSQPHQDFHWEGGVDAAGKLRLIAVDNGNVSERLDEVVVNAADGHRLGHLPGPIYVFPGEHRVLEVATAERVKPGPVKLQLQGTLRSLNADLVLSAQ
jgi:fimbrial chaperone protein